MLLDLSLWFITVLLIAMLFHYGHTSQQVNLTHISQFFNENVTWARVRSLDNMYDIYCWLPFFWLEASPLAISSWPLRCPRVNSGQRSAHFLCSPAECQQFLPCQHLRQAEVLDEKPLKQLAGNSSSFCRKNEMETDESRGLLSPAQLQALHSGICTRGIRILYGCEIVSQGKQACHTAWEIVQLENSRKHDME